jgi:hypothetical protein
MSVKYYKWPNNISTFSSLRPTKIYPNWDFWFWKQTIWQPCAGLVRLASRVLDTVINAPTMKRQVAEVSYASPYKYQTLFSHLSLYLFIYLFISLFLSLSVFLSFSLFISFFYLLSFIFSSFTLSHYLSTYLSLYVCMYLSICLSVCVSIHL